ncbi:MAG: Transcriptional regulator TraR/DksA family [Parcubacteria group bacterium GW2011_GWA1_50_14]|nr:MAG: Transcriptional regulator TraR/DksA family [Parcubacteria group bacterium GW2011_GWA1_50_14]
MLTKEKLEHYKKRLEEDKKRLLEEIKTDKDMVDFGDDVSDPEDEEADETEEQGNQMGVEQVLKERITNIDLALQKIGAGKYGICANCGSPISEKILGAAPESALCENCKKKA